MHANLKLVYSQSSWGKTVHIAASYHIFVRCQIFFSFDILMQLCNQIFAAFHFDYQFIIHCLKKIYDYQNRQLWFGKVNQIVIRRDFSKKENVQCSQSHYIEFAQGGILMEQKMRFRLVLGQLAVWGWLWATFEGGFSMFSGRIFFFRLFMKPH